jgi:hypothetical protein
MFSVRQQLNLDKPPTPDIVRTVLRKLLCLESGSELVGCEWRNGTEIRREDEERRSERSKIERAEEEQINYDEKTKSKQRRGKGGVAGR